MRLSSKELKRAQANGNRFIPSERQTLHQVVKWLKLAHPTVLFFFDYGADALLTPRQAKERKDLSCVRGWTELMIFEPRGEFCGLAIDLKREDVNVYNKAGLFANSHLEEQGKVMDLLTQRGWLACFAKGFLGSITAIEEYLKLHAKIPHNEKVHLP